MDAGHRASPCRGSCLFEIPLKSKIERRNIRPVCAGVQTKNAGFSDAPQHLELGVNISKKRNLIRHNLWLPSRIPAHQEKQHGKSRKPVEVGVHHQHPVFVIGGESIAEARVKPLAVLS